MRTKTAGPKAKSPKATKVKRVHLSPEFLSHRLSEAKSSIREMEAKTGQIAPIHMYAYLFSVQDAINRVMSK